MEFTEPPSITGLYPFVVGSDVSLPVDPSLTAETVTMPSLVDVTSGSYSSTSVKQAAVVIAEGLPPVSTKLLDKIQKWEFVELVNLLTHDTHGQSRGDTLTITQDGRSMVVRQQDESLGRKKITDITTWVQVFSIYAAILADSESSTSEQFKGLMAHMCLMIQLAKDLGGMVWLQYDREFRIWAAAKGVKVWGELNLSIYGRCLAAHQRPFSTNRPAPQKRSFDRRDDKKAKGHQNCCYKWNFDGSCHKPATACRYLHSCHFCGGDHRAMECPSPAPKSSKGY